MAGSREASLRIAASGLCRDRYSRRQVAASISMQVVIVVRHDAPGDGRRYTSRAPANFLPADRSWREM
jgi:hypothetical protein